MLRILLKKIDPNDELTTREILILLALHSQLEKNYRFLSVNFINHHWLLLSNILETHAKLSELLLVELPRIYNEHQIYFVSICNYLLKAVRGNSLRNAKLRHSFLDIVGALLVKSIKENRSYHAIWAV